MGDPGRLGTATRAGKYLTFHLGKEIYGLEILKVQEIIGMISTTRVPGTPPYIRGVANLRGKVTPLVDLRLKFGLEAAQDTLRTCVIVVQAAFRGQKVTMGIIVDGVHEVLMVGGDQIEPAPSFGTTVDTGFLLGIGKVGEKVILLLDVDRVLAEGDAEVLDGAARSG